MADHTATEVTLKFQIARWKLLRDIAASLHNRVSAEYFDREHKRAEAELAAHQANFPTGGQQ